jgi:hypothetical protein
VPVRVLDCTGSGGIAAVIAGFILFRHGGSQTVTTVSAPATGATSDALPIAQLSAAADSNRTAAQLAAVQDSNATNVDIATLAATIQQSGIAASKEINLAQINAAAMVQGAAIAGQVKMNTDALAAQTHIVESNNAAQEFNYSTIANTQTHLIDAQTAILTAPKPDPVREQVKNLYTTMIGHAPNEPVLASFTGDIESGRGNMTTLAQTLAAFKAANAGA